MRGRYIHKYEAHSIQIKLVRQASIETRESMHAYNIKFWRWYRKKRVEVVA